MCANLLQQNGHSSGFSLPKVTFPAPLKQQFSRCNSIKTAFLATARRGGGGGGRGENLAHHSLLLFGKPCSPKSQLCKETYLHIQVTTVKPVLTNTFLKRPPVLNNHVVVLPQVFRSNISLYSDPLYNATNNHLNDVPGFLLTAYNDHCTKSSSQKS